MMKMTAVLVLIVFSLVDSLLYHAFDVCQVVFDEKI